MSADTVKAQKNFCTKQAFPFPLLSDPEKEAIKAYEAFGLKKFMGKEYDGIHRTTFLIDEKGIVDKVISKVKTKDHAAQILERI